MEEKITTYKELVKSFNEIPNSNCFIEGVAKHVDSERYDEIQTEKIEDMRKRAQSLHRPV